MEDLALCEAQSSQEIIGREPSWIVRFGITLVFVVVTLLLLISWFIQYPDTIYSEVTVTTQQPPVQLVAKVNGRITRIFVAQGEAVEPGQPLVLLENSANYDTLMALKAKLQPLKPADLSQLDELDISELGQLQPFVNQLNQALNELHLHENSAQLATRIQNTEALSQQYQMLRRQLDNKLLTMNKKLALEAELLSNNQLLKKQGLVTAVELVAIENRYLDKKLALDDINIQSELYNVKIKEFAHQLSEYRIEREEQTRQLRTARANSYSALMSQIDQWQQTYLLVAPTAGSASFSNYWSINQQVKIADVVVSIVNGSVSKVGKMWVDQRGAGKIKPGQSVSIELASFPAQEYGKLEGTVKSIALLPDSRGYMVDVALPDTLTSSYGKSLGFTPNMTGKAKVVTQKKRLLERFLDKIIYAFDSV
ncbi:MAG: multidrug efflux pump subunit AcrA (membrane-fusion protein) [Phenylobacterium sp.]|jgi:multidrug efflux pump subunit AcrA (membrane-fusion protein)